MNVLISTYPFGTCGEEPIKLLEETGWDIQYNSLGRRLKGNEVKHMIENIDGVIAGTEPYTAEVLECGNNLKVISRVGVGLDNIDFDYCEKNNIVVTYTPEAPADAVAELTIAQIINLLRRIHVSNNSIKNERWDRIIGKLVKEIKVGILGVGRIGGRVYHRLKSFGGKIYGCDIDEKIKGNFDLIWMDKESLFKTCDLVTIHIPMNEKNRHCVGLRELSSMKEGSFVINTSRGPILDEDALVSVLYNDYLGGAALDVFEKEPYRGALINFENVILTAHIGASANQSRFFMELEAAKNCIDVLQGNKVKDIVTKDKFL
jgi:D-3-phosphoglycerate dehydrogenase